jgi:hypothetical protein
MDVCWFLDYIERPSLLCSSLRVKLLVEFEDVVQSLLGMCLLWCLFFDTHVTTHQSEYIGCLLQKSNQVTPAYFIMYVAQNMFYELVSCIL